MLAPTTAPADDGKIMRLELEDGYICEGASFGANKSVSGELVFQTGMVGYPESLTDPSYHGQILVCTFPLAGNYGVPSRDTPDKDLEGLPAYFEASTIHVAGLIVASYSGENFSHFLANSSLGTWLREQNVPAIHGVDTRVLTQHIREKGSMLGRLLSPKPELNGHMNYHTQVSQTMIEGVDNHESSNQFQDISWYNPNNVNLVSEGNYCRIPSKVLTFSNIGSIESVTSSLQAFRGSSSASLP